MSLPTRLRLIQLPPKTSSLSIPLIAFFLPKTVVITVGSIAVLNDYWLFNAKLLYDSI